MCGGDCQHIIFAALSPDMGYPALRFLHVALRFLKL
jgi:hypothetical protein